MGAKQAPGSLGEDGFENVDENQVASFHNLEAH